MCKAIRIFLVANIVSTVALSQNSFDTLDVNNIHAGFNAAGDLFWNINTSGTPISTPGNSIYWSAANLWIGGYDSNGRLHVSAQTYRQSGSDFWPGPLDTISAYCPQSVSTSYDFVWNISCAEVDSFVAYMQGSASPGYIIPIDMQTWPGTGGNLQSRYLAPFYDSDGDGVYNYAAGDYPLVRGSQSLFYVYNDSLQNVPHGETNSASLGLQIKAMPFAYAYPWDSALMNTIFIHYTLTNYKTYPYYGTRIGFWYDLDFNTSGGKDASDSTAQLAYHYNNDNAIGIYFLDDTMSGCINYDNTFSVTGNPQTPADYYELLNQQWAPTQTLTYGGSGYSTGAPTNWMYTGDPVSGTGWTDNTTATDHRTVVTLDSFVLYPGMSKEFVIALSFAHDTSGNYAAINKLFQYVSNVRQFYAGNNDFCSLQLSSVPENKTESNAIYPNPASSVITLNGTKAGKEFRIYNAMGSLVISGTSTSDNTVINISMLSSGIYTIVIDSDEKNIVAKFLKME